MARYPNNLPVKVRPFVHTIDGDEATIGDPQRQVFLAIPAPGLDLLRSLAAGDTVGEAVRRFEEKYAEKPDVDEFLSALAAEGFVAPAEAATAPEEEAPPSGPQRRQYTIGGDWIPPSTAQRIIGPALMVCALMSVGGIALAVAEPGLLPGPSALVFPEGNYAVLSWATFALAIFSVGLHELAHVLVARAAGASARVGIGNVMYTMVVQSDISGMWLAPKRQRYLAFVSGMIVDMAGASVMVALLYANDRGWITMSETVGVQLARALLFTYLLRISFQFFFYLRTDLYYVIATALRCRNLMGDTEAYLRNLLARVFRRPRWLTDQSGLPRHERRAIRFYAAVYVVGRSFSLAVLLLFFVPVLLLLAGEFALFVTGQREARLGAVDFLTTAAIVWIIDGGGLYLWLRSLLRGARDRIRARARSQRDLDGQPVG